MTWIGRQTGGVRSRGQGSGRVAVIVLVVLVVALAVAWVVPGAVAADPPTTRARGIVVLDARTGQERWHVTVRQTEST